MSNDKSKGKVITGPLQEPEIWYPTMELRFVISKLPSDEKYTPPIKTLQQKFLKWGGTKTQWRDVKIVLSE